MDRFIEWDVSYEVGIFSVDAQHKHLVELTNQLYEACTGTQQKLDEQFRSVMKELVDYVMFHFKDEERIMKEVEYPDLKEHKQKHEQFVKEILLAVSEYKDGKQFVPANFAFFLRDWLFNHILMTDKQMAKYYLSLK